MAAGNSYHEERHADFGRRRVKRRRLQRRRLPQAVPGVAAVSPRRPCPPILGRLTSLSGRRRRIRCHLRLAAVMSLAACGWPRRATIDFASPRARPSRLPKCHARKIPRRYHSLFLADSDGRSAPPTDVWPIPRGHATPTPTPRPAGCIISGLYPFWGRAGDGIKALC